MLAALSLLLTCAGFGYSDKPLDIAIKLLDDLATMPEVFFAAPSTVIT
jgi:hypothetical protein